MSNVIVDPRSFRDALSVVLHDHESQLRDAWTRGRDFTSVWKNPNGIYEQLGKRLALRHCHKEYWSIDAVYYERLDTDSFPAPGRYAEAIAIAVEHENNSATAHEEINKLSIIDAPLKVLVTYADPGNYADQLLLKFAAMLERADTFGDFATQRRHMVIFGHKDDEAINWNYFVFTGYEFATLPGA